MAVGTLSRQRSLLEFPVLGRHLCPLLQRTAVGLEGQLAVSHPRRVPKSCVQTLTTLVSQFSALHVACEDFGGSGAVHHHSGNHLSPPSPVSSFVSRYAACLLLSPRSTKPPGNDHFPFSLPYPRCMNRISPRLFSTQAERHFFGPFAFLRSAGCFYNPASRSAR